MNQYQEQPHLLDPHLGTLQVQIIVQSFRGTDVYMFFPHNFC